MSSVLMSDMGTFKYGGEPLEVLLPDCPLRDPGCGDLSDYLLDCRGRLSDFVFRVDVRGLVRVAPEARLAKCDLVRHPQCIV